MDINALNDYPRPIVSVDVVVLAVRAGRLAVLLAQRTHEPVQGALALPGGFVHPQEDEDLLSAARRVLRTKTGREARYVEQLATFGGPARDPRGWSLSVAHIALVSDTAETLLGDAERGLTWVPVDDCPPLPFDHNAIIAAALERVRNKASYSSLPALLLSAAFTFPELQQVYEQVLGTSLNTAAFRRKVEAQGLIEETGETRAAKGAGRPAQLYRLREGRLSDFGRVLMLPDLRRGG